MTEGFEPFEVKDLTAETILADEVFNYVFMLENHLARAKTIARLKNRAKTLGCSRTFDMMLREHQAEYANRVRTQNSDEIKFTNAPIEGLKCGQWKCVDSGVSRFSVDASFKPIEIKACPHPILPVERLVNIEGDTEKVKLSFFKDKKWKNIIVDKSTISSKHNIIMLSDRGIDVNSRNADELIAYLADVLSLNTKEIPLSKSIGRCGWMDKGFAPYINDLKYDGDIAFKDMYDSLKENGDYEDWKKKCKELRQKSNIARLVLAASFASPLLYKLDTLPFVVHMHGGTGSGKTVTLMMAMSIWGNPDFGKLVKSLNNTQVSFGRMAGFLNNIPFAGDELEIIKSKWTNTDQLIMFLCEGIDRGRGKASGGVDTMQSWKNCFLFTGEHPICKENSGGGVKNRVIEIYCDKKIIEDGNKTAAFFKQNYGFAGKHFIKCLPDVEVMRSRYSEIFKGILKTYDTTEKQSMSMSMNILADEIATEHIFKDNFALKIEDIGEFLTSEKEVDVAQRAFDWALNWIAQNINRFKNDNMGEIWGKIDSGYCFVNKNVLADYLNDNEFDYSAVTRKWAERGWITKNTQGKNVHCTHIYSVKGLYVKISLPDAGIECTIENDSDLPFKR